MSSRATAPKRDTPQKGREHAKKETNLDNRDFPRIDQQGNRKGVCRRCGLTITDCEPSSRLGEFWHIARVGQTRARACRNADLVFTVLSSEIAPFLRKSRRRYLKRQKIRP